jgi:hypothetical protein
MLEKLETRKDTIQVAVESAFNHVGQIAGIIAGAGREVTREIGEWATEVFEMREAARRAQTDPAHPDPAHPDRASAGEHRVGASAGDHHVPGFDD